MAEGLVGVMPPIGWVRAIDGVIVCHPRCILALKFSFGVKCVVVEKCILCCLSFRSSLVSGRAG